MKENLRIGTRGSRLALVQANYIAGLLKANFNGQISLEVIKTKGDKILDSPLSKIGDKGLFVKEIETALLDKRVDLAVHSMKDLPTKIPKGLVISGATKREDPRDAFISYKYDNLDGLVSSAVVGTSSLRRKSQLLNYRSDLTIKDIRGNLETRLRKLKDGEFDALIMASAGLKRMGYDELIKQFIDPSIILPAVAQAAIAVETRENDELVNSLTAKINDQNTFIETKAERALMAYLEGGCQVPIGCLAKIKGSKIKIQAVVASLNGRQIFKASIAGKIEEAVSLGQKLAQKILDSGADKVLEEIRMVEG